jgi:hypothetical protein
VATHLAHSGLLKRETVSALAAGVNIMLSPVTTVAICQLQVRTHWQRLSGPCRGCMGFALLPG